MQKEGGICWEYFTWKGHARWLFFSNTRGFLCLGERVLHVRRAHVGRHGLVRVARLAVCAEAGQGQRDEEGEWRGQQQQLQPGGVGVLKQTAKSTFEKIQVV